jgi:amino acid transporter
MLATLLVAVLYILCIVAYTAALSKDVIEHSGLTIAANFFLGVYGNNGFSKTFIPLCISISAFGNVLAVTFANSRVCPTPSFSSGEFLTSRENKIGRDN